MVRLTTTASLLPTRPALAATALMASTTCAPRGSTATKQMDHARRAPQGHLQTLPSSRKTKTRPACSAPRVTLPPSKGRLRARSATLGSTNRTRGARPVWIAQVGNSVCTTLEHRVKAANQDSTSPIPGNTAVSPASQASSHSCLPMVPWSAPCARKIRGSLLRGSLLAWLLRCAQAQNMRSNRPPRRATASVLLTLSAARSITGSLRRPRRTQIVGVTNAPQDTFVTA
jgi:hypothetical protein